MCQFIKPAIIYLESNPTEEFLRKMKKDSTKHLRVLGETAPKFEVGMDERTWKAAVKKHFADGEKAKHNRHIKMVNYVLSDKAV